MSDKPHPLYDAEKSWKKVRKLANEMFPLAKDLQRDSALVVLNTNKLIDLAVQMYIAIPKTDTKLMIDSPLFPPKLMAGLYKFMARLDQKDKRFAWLAKANPIDIYKAPDFVDVIKEATTWALKFEKSEVNDIV